MSTAKAGSQDGLVRRYRVGQVLDVRHGPWVYWFRVISLGSDGKPSQLKLCQSPNAQGSATGANNEGDRNHE